MQLQRVGHVLGAAAQAWFARTWRSSDRTWRSLREGQVQIEDGARAPAGMAKVVSSWATTAGRKPPPGISASHG